MPIIDKQLLAVIVLAVAAIFLSGMLFERFVL